MGKTKILYIVIGDYFNNQHRKFLSVIRNLDKKLFEFSIVCNENLLLVDYIKSFDVPVYILNLPGRISSKYSNLLNKLQLGERFDIVHSFDYISGIYGRLLKKFNPELKSIHSAESLAAIEHKGALAKQLVKSTMQYYSLFTDRLICESESEERLAIKNKYIGEGKSAVITPSVNISKFANLKTKIDLKTELGFDKDSFVIGNLANFEENNNQQVIIRAAYYLVKKYPQMRFLFIGSGKKLRVMQELANESKLENFAVFVNEKENIADYYSIMDLFVLADKWGGSSSVLLEVMASRLPVICSNASEYKPYAVDNTSLITFDANDMDNLFQKIDYLYKNNQRRETLAQNAMIEATQFDDSEMIQKIEALYSGVLEN